MKRSRFFALAAVTAAVVLVSSLMVASPASANTAGPLKNTASGLCLQGTFPGSSALVVQVPCDLNPTTRVSSNPYQQWSVACLNSGCTVVHYVNVGTGLCLRARGLNGPGYGEQIMLWACNQITDLNWTIHDVNVPGHDDWLGVVFESRISGSSGYCLDVPGASTTPGQALELWGCNGSFAQTFYFDLLIFN